jgi:quercetin dioxygenase-like cupin family protein
MSQNNASEGVAIVRHDDYDLADYAHLNRGCRRVMFQKTLYKQPGTGLEIKYVRYPRGCMIPYHSHDAGHGCYVLSGMLVTSAGTFGPGDFVWFDQGQKMTHGAGPDEGVDFIMVTDKELGMHYLDKAGDEMFVPTPSEEEVQKAFAEQLG